MLLPYALWTFLAGIAIFLQGIKFIEESLQQMSGRSFKLFLKKQTTSKVKALTGGTVVTAVLQSSSLVNLMVLAFVGAGIIQMQNSLAIVLGANLGTTLNSWLIVAIGFNADTNAIALPLVGIAGIMLFLGKKATPLYQWSKFLFGIGLLLFGLNYIKTGMEGAAEPTDLLFFQHYPSIVFLLLGFVFTALIQASSVTFAILLSALNIHAIDLSTAMAIVLGSEIGTSIKFVFITMRGQPEKKRVALANLSFNIIMVTLVFICLYPINHFITQILNFKDELLALVFFHSFVNIISILLFFPFLKQIGRFLEKTFTNKESETRYIHKVNVTDNDLAMEALEKETRLFLFYVSVFIETAFNNSLSITENFTANKLFASGTTRDKYEYIKHLHGEINNYGIQLGLQIQEQPATERLEQLTAVLRNAMYAAKSIKDAIPDIDQLRNSSNNLKYHFYTYAKTKVSDFYTHLWEVILSGHSGDSGSSGVSGSSKNSPNSDNPDNSGNYFNDLKDIYTSTQEEYKNNLARLYQEAAEKEVNETEFSTLINFNSELYASFNSFLLSAKDYLLEKSTAAHFDDFPGFIR